jgi:hypothetical protein
VVMSPAGLGSENDRWRGPAAIVDNTPFSPQRGCYIRTITASVQLENKNIGRESRGAWLQDELIGG